MSNRAQTRKTTRRAQQARKNKLQMGPVLGGLFVAIIVGWLGWNSWQNSQQPEIERVNVEGTQLGQIGPNFSVPILNGGSFMLREQRGKPTILFFMAYWCSTCIPEARALAQLQEKYGDSVYIIAIDVDASSTPELLEQFKQRVSNVAITWALDTGQQVAQAYQVRSLDTTLVLDAEGYIVYRDGAPTSYGTLDNVLASLSL